VHALLAEVLEAGLLPEERPSLHSAYATVLKPLGNPAELAVEATVDLADHQYAAGHRMDAYQWALLAAEAVERAGSPPNYWCAGGTCGIERVGSSQAWTTLGEAVRISSPYPESWEHALALAALGHAELWRDIPSGPVHAGEAVRVARASGSATALAWALTARAMAKGFAGADEGIQDAEEAQAAAIQARDFRASVPASTWAGNCLDCSASPAVLERWRRGREAWRPPRRRTPTPRGCPPAKHPDFY
jgi:hypothetical protein